MVNNKDRLKSIIYYDSGLKKKVIDIDHEHKNEKPHVHEGYYHGEKDTRRSTAKEKALIDRVARLWYRYTQDM